MAATAAFITESPTILSSETEEKRRSQSPKRSGRHTKGLSLNFPILLPTQHPSSTTSPTSTSPTSTSARASPHMKAGSLPAAHGTVQSPSRTSTDFLTLVAAQERKVLELREELAKADAELTALKKQWAVYEANKKREEARQVRRMPVHLDDVPSPVSTDQNDLEEERRRRRALVEMSNNTNGEVQNATRLGRRGSKRVFEGRHTKALSLLSPSSGKNAQPESGKSLNELVEADPDRRSEDLLYEQRSGTPPLSRMPTLDGLVSPEILQRGFGKTYKDLATHRHSLPPAAAETFMRQSRQVVDGVREGLWTFFEDIRQATVGDEAVNEPVDQQRWTKATMHPTRAKSQSTKSGTASKQASKDSSFWKEFGLETPAKPQRPEKENRTAHVHQKGSTGSQDPPDLLEDTNGEENNDDWDNWEPPTSPRKEMKSDTAPTDSGGLPWPELTKLTPSKLTRTASNLMREWHTGDDAVAKD